MALSGNNRTAAVDTGTTLIGGPADDIAKIYAGVTGSRVSQNFDGFYEFRMLNRPLFPPPFFFCLANVLLLSFSLQYNC